MLIKFQSVAAGEMLMFGDAAESLLKMMGMTGHLQGGIKAGEIPAAIERLQKALSGATSTGQTADDEEDDKASAKAVGLRQRAFPLIEFLRRSAAEDADVMWDRA